MQSFSSPTTISRGRAVEEQACFPKLLLVTLLLVGALLTVFVPSTANAKAIPVSTHVVQLSELTMIDQHHGWAISIDRKHVFYTYQGPEHWIDVTPSLFITDSSTYLTTSFFFNATRGYLGVLQNNQPRLLSTQNSGRTWQTTPFTIPIISNPVGIHQITFLDSQHGWLSFNRNNSQPGYFDILLMSTSNGGKTWQTLLDTTQNPSSLPVPYGLSSNLTFVSPQNGWVTGIWLSGDVYLYETHDGGKTWSPANIMPLKGSDNINSAQSYGPFWQNDHSGTLFIQYATSSGNAMPHLTAYQTYDGGKTWTLEPSSPATSFQEFDVVSFINAQEGWSFGFDDQGQYAIHHTSTGGASWEIFHPTTGLPQANAASQAVLYLKFLNVRTGWVIIGDGLGNSTLFQTNDGGHSWHALQPVAG